MKIECLLNEENFIVSYTDPIFSMENTVSVELPSEYISKKKVIVDDTVVEETDIIGAFFYENFVFFRVENGIAVYDNERKKSIQNKKIPKELSEVRIEILRINADIASFRNNNWDCMELLNKLNNLHVEEKRLLNILETLK